MNTYISVTFEVKTIQVTGKSEHFQDHELDYVLKQKLLFELEDYIEIKRLPTGEKQLSLKVVTNG